MPERLKDKRRPFIFSLADVLINQDSSKINQIYDDADTYLFGKRKLTEKSKEKQKGKE